MSPNLSDLLDSTPGPAAAQAYLRRVQAALNWVPREAVLLAAEHYQCHFLPLYEFVSLEPGFSLEPRGRKVVEVCQGLACREVGSRELLEELERVSGLRRGETAQDGSLSLLAGYCMGNCAIGANVKVNGQLKCGQGMVDVDSLTWRAKSKLDPNDDKS